MTVTILSPHPDDAVLSCWHVLAGAADVDVVNVFAGAPARSETAGWWDALTGAGDPVTRMAERREEDRRALAHLGRRATNLSFLDAQYRRRAPARATLRRAIEAHASEIVYAPAALSGHPDHLLVRTHALGLRALGVEVRLYADMPHAIAFGWPAWISGEAADRYLRPERLWDWWLAGTGLASAALHVDIRPMNGMAPAKHEAVSEYRTQAAALTLFMSGERFRYEVAWSLAAGAA